MIMSDAEIHVVEALRLEPGDKVLLTAEGDLDHEDARLVVERLGERFPGCSFTVVAGMHAVRMERASE